MIRIERIAMLEMESHSVTTDHHTAGKKFLKIRRSFNKLLPPLPIGILTFYYAMSIR
jgi:hypothetical protein